MKKRVIIPVSVALCLSLIAGGTTLALSDDKKDEKNISDIVSVEDNSGKLQKDETVYVLASADGTVKKIIVSDWIKNTLKSSTLTDYSELENAENVKGDESYTVSGENCRVWEAQGNDIYYQGNIDKELPVDLSVTYYLDGKAVSADEIKGKSGKVKIRYDYRNKQYETVNIDGKDEKIYVPFVMITGLMLDNDIFTNVNVTNGKLINDGDRTIVAGFALPGMQENLNLDKEKLELPDYIEITADAKDFEMTNTVTIAANDMLNMVNTDNLDSVDDLDNAIKQLTDAMTALCDGSDKLYGGLCTLLNKSGELISGVDKLCAGAQQLKDGAAAVDAGAGQIKDGLTELDGGLTELDSNNAKLNGGARQIFESVLATAQEKISSYGITVDKLTPENYNKVLSDLITSPTQEQQQELIAMADKTVNAELAKNNVPEENRSVVKYMLAKRVIAGKTQDEAMGEIAVILQDAKIYSTVPSALPVYKALYDAVYAQMPDAAVAERITSVAVYLAIQSGAQPAQCIPAAQAVAANAKVYAAEAAESSTETGAKVTNGFLLAAAQKTINEAKTSLDSVNTFNEKLKEYTDGVTRAKNGTGKLVSGSDALKDGTSSLKEGTETLYNGILTLKDGTPALVSGITELRDGSRQLSDGLKEFNESGVKKITDAVDGDLKGLFVRIKAVGDVSKDYTSFTGISEDMAGKVKFIYRTDAIEK